jgi:hypothetical protein
MSLGKKLKKNIRQDVIRQKVFVWPSVTAWGQSGRTRQPENVYYVLGGQVF